MDPKREQEIKDNVRSIFDFERCIFVGFEKKPMGMRGYWFCGFNALVMEANPPRMGKMVTFDLGLN